MSVIRQGPSLAAAKALLDQGVVQPARLVVLVGGRGDRLQVRVEAGDLSATIGQYFWVQAFKAGEMSAVAPFEYLRLPFAVFVGWLIWGEMPFIQDPRGMAAGALRAGGAPPRGGSAGPASPLTPGGGGRPGPAPRAEEQGQIDDRHAVAGHGRLGSDELARVAL